MADSFEGAVYQKIDNAILTSAIAEKKVNNSFGGEDTGNPTTDFSIEGINSKESRYLGLDTHRNEYNIEYEGSSSGLYNVLGGKGAMKGIWKIGLETEICRKILEVGRMGKKLTILDL